jgi:hypothetical protein
MSSLQKDEWLWQKLPLDGSGVISLYPANGQTRPVTGFCG